MSLPKEIEKLGPLPDPEEWDGLFYDFLPYSDLAEWVPENSVYEDVLRAFPLSRLDGIRALSFLAFTGPPPEMTYAMPFHHDRFDHSLVVAMVLEKILRNNGFSEQEVNTGIIAALLHDIATPAHGDAIKPIDPENLHEEDH